MCNNSFGKVLKTLAFAAVIVGVGSRIFLWQASTLDDYYDDYDYDYDYDYDWSSKYSDYVTTDTTTDTTTQTTTSTTTSTSESISQGVKPETTQNKPQTTKPQEKHVPEYVDVKFSWKSSLPGGGTTTWTLSLDKAMYKKYTELKRTYGVGNYTEYIDDAYNAALIDIIADGLTDYVVDKGYDKSMAFYEAINFVQAIEYAYDLDENGKSTEYPKYPLETLFEGKGDCEDTAILLAAILEEMGYGIALIDLPGHVAVGVWSTNYTGAYYTVNNSKYYYLESTGEGWGLGQIPDEYKSIEASGIYVI